MQITYYKINFMRYHRDLIGFIFFEIIVRQTYLEIAKLLLS